MTNSNAYVACALLMGSYTLVMNGVIAIGIWKWATIVTVMNIVDVLWLSAGVLLGRAHLPPSAQRGLTRSLAFGDPPGRFAGLSLAPVRLRP